jgi:hypothetical protein
VEPRHCEAARAVGDADDLLIEQLTAIASALDPVPAAVQESVRRLFETEVSNRSNAALCHRNVDARTRTDFVEGSASCAQSARLDCAHVARQETPNLLVKGG